MSIHQYRTQLLIYGFVDQQIHIPNDLIQLIEYFYDEYFCWKLKDIQWKQVQKNIRSTTASFKIKGIECTHQLVIHQWNGEDILVNVVRIGNLPTNIEYVDFCAQIQCETITRHETNSSTEIYTCNTPALSIKRGKTNCIFYVKSNSSEFVHAVIDIKYIKYKNDCNKIDYVSINKMNQYYTFEWNICNSNLSTFSFFKEIIEVEQTTGRICSEKFNGNNWHLVLEKNDDENVYYLYLQLHYLPLLCKSIDVRYRFLTHGRGEWQEYRDNYDGTPYVSNSLLLSCDEWKIGEIKSICVQLMIVAVYGKNNGRIEKSSWVKYGIQTTNPMKTWRNKYINKIKKYTEFTARFTMSQLQRYLKYKMCGRQPFSHKNWELLLYWRKLKREWVVRLHCLSLSDTISSIDIKYRFCLNSNIHDNLYTKEMIRNFGFGMNRKCKWTDVIMCYNEFTKINWLSVTVMFHIINVYDKNNEKIKENEWNEHGIQTTNLIDTVCNKYAKPVLICATIGLLLGKMLSITHENYDRHRSDRKN
eukprot:313414_1